jgi:DNA-binding winged helix-turn-helix (wHTH) protein/tetratricopeptide (TPR) repeat protein
MVHRFGDYELDEAAGELRCRGRAVEIQPKPFALLAFLVRERARTVPARELLDELWPDTTVSLASLTRAISHARRAIGDTNRGTLIRSVSRRGYRFCGELKEPARQGAAAGPAAGAREPASIFVAREDELARLERALAEAVSGRGSVAIVSGPAGIGKTRLVEHFAALAGERGACVLFGRNRAEEGVPPFWLWLQILRQLLELDAARPVLREIAARSPELAELLPELAAETAAGRASRASDSELSRFLVFDAVSRALARASRSQPLVIVLEDLQWADPPSLRLLEHFAFEITSESILVLASVREEFRARGHPLDGTLRVLRQQERVSELALASFSRREVAALLARVLGRPAPTDLTSEMFARTEGVPLFLREAIRLLAERGMLDEPEKLPRAGIVLPGRALDLIRRALDSLPERAAALVTAGAVLGRDFTLAAAAELAGLSRESALDLADDAARAGVLEASPDDAASWRFTHALFREAAYAGIAAGERVRLHLRAAQRLEREHAAAPDAVVAELAHHHHRALAIGDPERAFAVALRAAELAAQLGAWEQAAQHYEQAVVAIAHAGPVQPARRLGVLLAFGEACRLSGERTRRREVLADAMSLARSLGRTEDLARAAIGFSDLQDWGVRDEAARRAVTEALAAIGDSPSVSRARLLTRLAYFDVQSAHDAAQPIAREAVELARAAADPEALQDALYVLHFALGGPDHVEERARIGDETARAASDSRSADRALIAQLDLASDRVMLGDAPGARSLRARAAAIAGERPTPAMRWHTGVYDTGIALLEGRFDEVSQRAQDAFALGRRVEHPYARGVLGAHLALLAWERGDSAQVLALFEPTLGALQGPLHWVGAVVARARLALGREDEARALFESLARESFLDVPRNLRWTDTLVELAVLCAELDDAARAKPLQELLAPVEHQHGSMPIAICYGGPVRFALARLCETLGRGDDAASLYEEARASVESLGARPALARISLHEGRFWAERERRRAKPALQESARLASELGMAAVEAAARRALASLE